MKQSKKRLAFTLFTLLVIVITTVVIGALARGYRLDFDKRKLRPYGLLAATSTPDGASVWINGRLKTATNQTISLPPGSYQIKIQKPGYTDWEKTITVYKELVVPTHATLFPLAPDLKALNFTKTEKPQISPDGGKIVYLTKEEDLSSSSPSPASPSATPFPSLEKTPIPIREIKIIELSEKPLAHLPKPKLLAKIPSQQTASFLWSPDSRQILLTLEKDNKKNQFLLDVNETYDFTHPPLLSLSHQEQEEIHTLWEKQKNKEEKSRWKKIPTSLKEILQENCQEISFSPDETKILYQAQKKVSIPEKIIPQDIIALSSQKEERHLKPKDWYVFDLKEDKNFLIFSPKDSSDSLPQIRWFPTSRHLLLVYPQKKVDIIEYDGTNRNTIYQGPLEDHFAYPFPSGKNLLILTSLGGQSENNPNFYAVSLR